MGEYHIRGGRKLSGELTMTGAKNSALPILAAVILNAGESVIHNCPRITDTFISLEILSALGCKTAFENNTFYVDSSTLNNCVVPEALAGEMRSSTIFLGAILGRYGEVQISYPGGCER